MIPRADITAWRHSAPWPTDEQVEQDLVPEVPLEMLGQLLDAPCGLSQTKSMATVNVHEAKTHLSSLLQRASAGERIIIARAGKPVAVLGPIAPASKERVPGLLKGRVRIGRDFDAPLPDEILDAFRSGAGVPE